MTTEPKLLPNAAFLVLCLLGEGEAHGYHLEQHAWNRGFRYWTDAKRSAIYGALKRLEKEGLVTSRLVEGEGPARKVYSLTPDGERRLAAEALEHLTAPDHPRNELDLGLYALPFIPAAEVAPALARAQAFLRGRLAFIEERARWCADNGLLLVALNFERPALTIRAEMEWLRRVEEAVVAGALDASSFEWQRYEYRQPPEPRVLDDPPPGPRRP
jgi:DNA-binding PadR family transcriptional regulator